MTGGCKRNQLSIIYILYCLVDSSDLSESCCRSCTHEQMESPDSDWLDRQLLSEDGGQVDNWAYHRYHSHVAAWLTELALISYK